MLCPIRFLFSALILLGIACVGCGKSTTPTGCPADLEIPEAMVVLGSKHDQSLFVLRLKTSQHRIPQAVTIFKETMDKNEWSLKLDSTTDRGGELEFSKKKRKCVVFIAPEKETDSGNIKIDIKCDRENVR
ncbi:MAG: hypothetical protein VX438_06060 [Planctomycetota bacterium]|nr:hypothetical protein [Planctomycetota bacterium]